MIKFNKVIKNIFPLTISLVICILLSSCSLIKKKQVIALSWDERIDIYKDINTFKTNGRVGITGIENSGSASFIWDNEYANDYSIKLHGPFGANSVEINVSPNRVRYIDQLGNIKRAKNPRTLLFNETGWDLPLESLKYWIKAIPDRNFKTQSLILDKNQRIEYLRQNDWDISYFEYQNVNGFEFPKKIMLKKHNVKIRFVFTSWKFIN